jgi:hypothetical protein
LTIDILGGVKEIPPHPEERREAMRLEGMDATQGLAAILRDAAHRRRKSAA